MLDADGRFAARCNSETVGSSGSPSEDAALLLELLEHHHAETASPVAAALLAEGERCTERFWKVLPHDLRRARERGNARRGGGER